jgi:YegS/Rv2252/BmrU family lipid kinase
MKYKIIVNPTSGRGAGAVAKPKIEQLLTKDGLDFDINLTEHPWHAADLAEQAVAIGFDVVVAVGGDGTANEVLNGLMRVKKNKGKTATMGILSVGRGNDFAYGMNIPNSLEAGCQVLTQGYRHLVDIGFVSGGLYPKGRYFGNGVGIGFDAVVGFVAAKMKRLSGFPSYIVAALETIFLYYKAPLVQIDFNGKTLTQLSLMVSIMNGRRLGGGFYTAPRAETDDGLFDLCIAGQVSRPRIFPLILLFMKGTQDTHPAIQIGRTQSITVTALKGVIPAHADGETLCVEGQKLALEIVPKEIEIISQPLQ